MRPGYKYLFLVVTIHTLYFNAFCVEGESLFIDNCMICHTIGQGNLIGPDLKYIDEKRSFEYFMSFVKNSQIVIKSGDSTAVSIYNDFNEIIMPENNLDEKELLEIWQFIQSFEGESYYDYVVQSSDNQIAVFLNLWLFLGVILLFLVVWKRNLFVLFFRNLYQLLAYNNLFKGQWRLFLILFLIAILVTKLNSIGIFTGYQPRQPILFSHTVHCKQNKINCKYCHYEAYKGMHGGIPPLATCMNCHKYVRKGTLTDTVEITKLYDWAGFDPATKDYSKQAMLPGWIKVYNLPDHSRFNHQIHTSANIGCAECHGEVDEMMEIKQATPLSMKWCIDCHRKELIPLVGYYSEKMTIQKGYKTMITSDRANFAFKPDTIFGEMKRMGGLDCYKCHY